jgi:hypothetical protein
MAPCSSQRWRLSPNLARIEPSNVFLEIFAEIFSPNHPTWVEAGLRRQAPRQLGCQPGKIFRHRCKSRAPLVGLRCLPSPRYRSSGGIRTEPRSGGLRTMKLASSVSVSATKIWRFPPLGFCFLRDLSVSSPGQCLGLFDGLDALPFVRRRSAPHTEISQPKFMR